MVIKFKKEKCELLVNALRNMHKYNDVIKDSHGNISLRDGDLVYIKPSGMYYDEIRSIDVCIIDITTGEQLPNVNIRKPSVDTEHHIEIYKKHSHIKSICHTHSPYAVAYAVAGQWLSCYTTEQADYFGRIILCKPYANYNSWGKELSTSLHRDEKAVLLANHGVITVGEDEKESVKLAIAVENIAYKNYIIESLCALRNMNSALVTLEYSEMKAWHKRYNEKYGQ